MPFRAPVDVENIIIIIIITSRAPIVFFIYFLFVFLSVLVRYHSYTAQSYLSETRPEAKSVHAQCMSLNSSPSYNSNKSRLPFAPQRPLNATNEPTYLVGKDGPKQAKVSLRRFPRLKTMKNPSNTRNSTRYSSCLMQMRSKPESKAPLQHPRHEAAYSVSV
jgi:hypothetical protein